VRSNKRSLWLGLALAAGCALGQVFGAPARADEPADAAETTANANQPQEFPQGILFPYSLLDAALTGQVEDKNGFISYVNYLALQKNRALDLFVQAVATADLSKFPVLPKKVVAKDKQGREVEQTLEDHSAELVFWINAYNAHVLKAIATVYPITTPDDIKDFDTAKTHRVAGKDYSFAEMRKKILSLDPRGFFALSDGTLGGPALRSHAYRLTNLDGELDFATKLYISNPNQVQLLMLEKKTTVNPILQEVDEYFASKGARRKWDGIRQLLVNYSSVSSSQHFYINNDDYQIAFARAIRTLNRDPNSKPVAGG